MVPITTSIAKGTELNLNDGTVGSSGVTDDQRRIIIGVIVGLGGAIILGGLAVVVWRVWGRKRHYVDDNDSLMKQESSLWQKAGLGRSTGASHKRTPTLNRPLNVPVTQASNF